MKLKIWKVKRYHNNSTSYAVNKWARGWFIQFGLFRMTIPTVKTDKPKSKARSDGYRFA